MILVKEMLLESGRLRETGVRLMFLVDYSEAQCAVLRVRNTPKTLDAQRERKAATRN